MAHRNVQLWGDREPREADFEQTNHGGGVAPEASDLVRGDDSRPVKRLAHAVPQLPC